VTEPPFADRVIDDFVKPFYLAVKMRRALDPVQASILADKARLATTEEILWMLDSEWRPRRVGAWFSMLHPEPEIDMALTRSLETSLGYLTAPDLGFAAARRLGTDALPALHEYQTVAVRDRFGGISEMSALIESLGGRSQFVESTELDRESVANRRDWAEFMASH
jgi:hypothetical protein